MNRKYIFIIPVLFCLFTACSDNTARSNTDTTEIKNSVAVKEDQGGKLFEAKCAACHGADGTAGIGNAANLQTSKLDSAAIIQTVTYGKGGMPSFKNILNEEEIHTLENYVHTLRK